MPPKSAGKPKCHDCRHKRGPRRLGSGIRNTSSQTHIGHEAKIINKKPCDCNCHG